MDFKNYTYEQDYIAQELNHLYDINDFLIEANRFSDNELTNKIYQLSDNALSLLVHSVSENMHYYENIYEFKMLENYMNSDEDGILEAKQREKGTQWFDSGQGKRRFFRPHEMGSATDKVTNDYSQHLGLRRLIMNLVKRTAQQEGGDWQNVLTKLKSTDVLNHIDAYNNSPKNKNKITDEDKEAIDGVMAKMKKAVKQGGGNYKSTFANTANAGFKEDWKSILRKHLSDQEPLVRAVNKFGSEAGNEEIINYLKSNNIPIISPELKKHLVIAMLKNLAKKVETGTALDNGEQQAYKVWKQLSESPQAAEAERLLRYSIKNNTPLFDQDYIDNAMINAVKSDVAQGHGYVTPAGAKDSSEVRKFDRQMKTWDKDKEKDPNALPFVAVNFHGDKDQEGKKIEPTTTSNIMQQYFNARGGLTELGQKDLVPAVCFGCRQAVAIALRSAGKTADEIKMNYYFNPKNIGGLCGQYNPQDKSSQSAMQRIEEFLGISFSDLTLAVLEKIKHKNKPGLKDNAFRVMSAKIIACQFIQKLLQNQNAHNSVVKDLGHQANSSLKQDIQNTDVSKTRHNINVDAEDDARELERHLNSPEMKAKALEQYIKNPEAMVQYMSKMIDNADTPEKREVYRLALAELQAQGIAKPKPAMAGSMRDFMRKKAAV